MFCDVAVSVKKTKWRGPKMTKPNKSRPQGENSRKIREEREESLRERGVLAKQWAVEDMQLSERNEKVR